MRRRHVTGVAAGLAQPLSTSVPGLSLVELIGNQRLLIEQHMGIVAYSKEELCVKVRGGLIRVSGKSLCVCKMSAYGLLIKGTVESIAYLEGGA